MQLKCRYTTKCCVCGTEHTDELSVYDRIKATLNYASTSQRRRLGNGRAILLYLIFTFKIITPPKSLRGSRRSRISQQTQKDETKEIKYKYK